MIYSSHKVSLGEFTLSFSAWIVSRSGWLTVTLSIQALTNWRRRLGNAARTNQQLDRARVLRGRRWKFPTGTSEVPPPSSTKWVPYLNTIWTVALTEDQHLIGVNKILYPSFEFILPGIIFDGRHFQGISVRLRKASFDRQRTREWGKKRN